MAKHRICRIPGDGIGHDVMEAATIVVEALGLDLEWVDADAGWCMWEKHGNTVPEATWKALESTKCCLFGAITSKPGVKGFKSAILQIRQRFDMYINLRPMKSYEGNPLNFRNPKGENPPIDMVIFRENTEGLYSAVEFHPTPEAMFEMHPGMERFKGRDVAVSCRVFTRDGCRRIVEAAFKYAKEHGRKKVTAVHKANVIRLTCGMFLEEFREVAKQYPDIETTEENVDAVTMWFVKNPDFYDVLVTTNMFGDIISDEAAQLVGGLGFAASANMGDRYALFEPSHGSAPKYAGMYKVNPTAMIKCIPLMCDYIGEKEEARAVEAAIARVVKEGKVRTYDLGGSNTTLEVGQAIADAL
ncbi:isocitrate/isopropylmalate dehydrogenase family protein [Candidatus Sumerlaeota bacterium]|nr:isocitrate/isopropylmalate dehydrogenase family protein [Candidatus Sumerlaeota bacterium]